MQLYILLRITKGNTVLFQYPSDDKPSFVLLASRQISLAAKEPIGFDTSYAAVRRLLESLFDIT